jgi:hypothetical protein
LGADLGCRTFHAPIPGLSAANPCGINELFVKLDKSIVFMGLLGWPGFAPLFSITFCLTNGVKQHPFYSCPLISTTCWDIPSTTYFTDSQAQKAVLGMFSRRRGKDKPEGMAWIDCAEVAELRGAFISLLGYTFQLVPSRDKLSGTVWPADTELGLNRKHLHG